MLSTPHNDYDNGRKTNLQTVSTNIFEEQYFEIEVWKLHSKSQITGNCRNAGLYKIFCALKWSGVEWWSDRS